MHRWLRCGEYNFLHLRTLRCSNKNGRELCRNFTSLGGGRCKVNDVILTLHCWYWWWCCCTPFQCAGTDDPRRRKCRSQHRRENYDQSGKRISSSMEDGLSKDDKRVNAMTMIPSWLAIGNTCASQCKPQRGERQAAGWNEGRKE